MPQKFSLLLRSSLLICMPGLLAADEWPPLSKTDAELNQIITHGASGKPMPPFGSVLKPDQIRDVLAYLRSAFGANSPSTQQPDRKL